MGQQQDKQTRLELAQALVQSLQAGDESEADNLIETLSKGGTRDELFVEVGRLTRELHDAINGFLLDARIADMTNIEIPDAKERLNYVITMTQQSADRTLNEVEKCLPMVEAMERQATRFLDEWSKLNLSESDPAGDLSAQLNGFLQQTGGDAKVLRASLSEVLMAQDFQDLTGQIIRKVIRLVQDVEQKLVKLVRITGSKLDEGKAEPKAADKLAGPAIPGLDQGDQVSGQDEVDDLLSSLGF